MLSIVLDVRPHVQTASVVSERLLTIRLCGIMLAWHLAQAKSSDKAQPACGKRASLMLFFDNGLATQVIIQGFRKDLPGQDNISSSRTQNNSCRRTALRMNSLSPVRGQRRPVSNL